MSSNLDISCDVLAAHAIDFLFENTDPRKKVAERNTHYAEDEGRLSYLVLDLRDDWYFINT